MRKLRGAFNRPADTSSLEREIDERVYRLYGLTKEEIGIVEGRRDAVVCRDET